MPFAMNGKAETELETVYRRFFGAARRRLTDKGRIIMFSRNPDMAVWYSKAAGYRLLERFLISEKNNGELMIFGHEG